MIKEKILAFINWYRPKTWWSAIIVLVWMFSFVFFYAVMMMLGLVFVSNAFYDKPTVCPNDCITGISYMDDVRTIMWGNGTATSTSDYTGGETMSYFACYCDSIISDENLWLNIFSAAEWFYKLTIVAGLIYLFNGGLALAINVYNKRKK